MAQVGSVAILIKLVGGQQVLTELRNIRAQADQLANKPVTMKVDVSQIVKAQEQVTQSKQKAAKADQDAIKAAELQLRIEEHQLKLAERLQQADEKRAASAARGAEARMKRDEQAARELEKAGTQAARQQNVYDNLIRSQANGFQRAMDDMQREVQAKTLARNTAFQSGLNTLASGLGGVSGLWDRGLQGMMRFSDGLVHAGQVAATFAYRLTLITAPLDILIAKSLQFSIQLEASLAKVGTQLDGSIDSIRQYMSESRDLIVSLQQEYGVPGAQQADALYYLVSSGVEKMQAQAALEPITRLAAVTGASGGVVSQALAATLNVFGDELSRIPDLTERVTYALEVMFDATRKGRFEFTDFATQFGRAAEMVKQAGGSFEDASAMLAALSQVFTPSQATTTLNSFAKAFINPVDKAKEAWDALGISMYKTVGGEKVKRELMDVFTETFDKLSKISAQDIEKADKILALLFGDLRGGRGAQFFIDPRNRNLLNDILSSLGFGEDNIAKAWELTREQIQTQINITQGTFLKLGTTITDTMKPAILGGLEMLKSLFEAIAANPQVVNILSGVAVAMSIIAPASLVLGTALMGVGGLVTAIGVLMSPAYLIGFSIVLQGLSPLMQSVGNAAKEFGGGLTGLLGMVTELAHQFGILSDEDALRIFERLDIKVTPESVNRVTALVNEIKKLGDNARGIVDNIMKIADAIGTLIDRIGRGEGILGKFASVASGLAGFAAERFGAATSGDIAGTLDTIIGGALLAKFGAVLVGALAKLNAGVMYVTAGQVTVAGAANTGLNAFGGTLASAGGGSLLKGAGLFTVAAAGVAIAQNGLKNVMDAIWGDDGLIPTIIKQIAVSAMTLNPSVLGMSFMVGMTDIINNVIEMIAGEINKQFGTSFSTNLPSMSEMVGKTISNVIGAVGEAINAALGHPTIVADRSYDSIEAVRASEGFGKVSEGASLSAKALGAFAPSVLTATGAIGRLGAAASQAAAAWNAIDIGQRVADYVFGSPTVQDSRLDQYDSRFKFSEAEAATLEENTTNFNTVMGYLADSMKPAGDAAKKMATELENAANKIKDTIKGLVKDAMASSKVTDEDIAATEAGTYKDKPDEFARRARAVATGTDPSIYGEEFAKQYALAQQQMPGASADEIANAFDDRSLFAKMSAEDIESMWDWDAIVASVKRGIDRIVGEFKLMKSAIERVISELSSEDLNSLAEALGVKGDADAVTSELMKKLGGAGGEPVSTDFTATFGKENESFAMVKQYVEWIEKIPRAIQTVISLALDKDFEEIANKFIDFLNSIPLNITVGVNFATNAAGGTSGSAGIPPFTAPGSGSGANGFADIKDAQVEGKAGGGYVEHGLYMVGEKGKEYVLPHGITNVLESMLGGKINSPFDIFRLMRGQPGRGDERMGGSFGGSNSSIWIQNAVFQVPNGATMESLGLAIRSRAAQGYD